MNKEAIKEFDQYVGNMATRPNFSGTTHELYKWLQGFDECQELIRGWLAHKYEEEVEKEKKTRFEGILESVDEGKRQRPEEWTDREMFGEEDRDQIVRMLQELLQHTRAGAELVALRRIPGKDPAKYESVEAEFMNGGKKRHGIEGDSGIGIIRDVLKMFG